MSVTTRLQQRSTENVIPIIVKGGILSSLLCPFELSDFVQKQRQAVNKSVIRFIKDVFLNFQ